MRVAEKTHIGALRSDFFGRVPEMSFYTGSLKGDLGISLRKTVKKVGKTAKGVVKKVGKGLKRVGKKITKAAKKTLMKYGSVIALASQLLNFVVPGLGVAVSLAITAGSAALNARASVQASKKAGKAAEQEAAAAEADAKQKEDEAEKSAMDAYLKGEEFFVREYDMTRERFEKLSLEEKLEFLAAVTADYDAHVAKLMEQGEADEDKVLGLPSTYVAIGAVAIVAVPLLYFVLAAKKKKD